MLVIFSNSLIGITIFFYLVLYLENVVVLNNILLDMPSTMNLNQSSGRDTTFHQS